ncbi:MAG: hypothetical protein R2875_09370 [Desulfobacterales bacterium]
MNYKVLGDDFMVQVGRMYVPFTRNYGTTSTKSCSPPNWTGARADCAAAFFTPESGPG